MSLVQDASVRRWIMKVTIDRIEDGIAVVELPDMTTLDIPAKLFDDIEEGAVYEISRDLEVEKKRKAKIKNMFESLFE